MKQRHEAKDHRGFEVGTVTMAITFVLIVATPTVPGGQTQVANSVPDRTVLKQESRVVLDSSALQSSSMAIPYWANGRLIVRETESYTADLPNIRLYDNSGQKAREASVWFSGSQRVVVNSVATGVDGTLLATGEADKSDGTRAFFLASLDATGRISHAIQMGDYHPRHVCGAPDGTVWTLGGTRWDASAKRPTDGPTLRNFDFIKGELNAFIPRSRFTQDNFDAGGTWMRCTKRGVEAVLASGEYIILRYGEKEPRIYTVPVVDGTFVAGFAVLDSGRRFAYLGAIKNSAKSASGLYELILSEMLQTGTWQRVTTEGGSSTSAADVYRLWGADGDSLVVSLASDPMNRQALQWLKVGTAQ